MAPPLRRFVQAMPEACLLLELAGADDQSLTRASVTTLSAQGATSSLHCVLANASALRSLDCDDAAQVDYRLGLLAGGHEGLFNALEDVWSSEQAVTVDSVQGCNPFDTTSEAWIDLVMFKVAPTLVAVTWRDVTDRVVARRRLEHKHELYRMLAQNIADVVLLVAEQKIEWVSPSIRSSLGYSVEAFQSHLISNMCHADDEHTLANALALASQGEQVTFRCRILHRDGTWRWVEARAQSPEGHEGLTVIMLRLIDDQVSLEAQLRYSATHDALTGLANRQQFYTELADLLRKLRRGRPSEEEERVALAYCDLDLLKKINDEHGHRAGDEALRIVAQRMRSTLRSSDLAARVGGDEFLIAFADVRSDTDVLLLAERVRQAVREAVVIEGVKFELTMSIGVARIRHDLSVEQAVIHADEALYKAKQTGRDRVVTSW